MWGKHAGNQFSFFTAKTARFPTPFMRRTMSDCCKFAVLHTLPAVTGGKRMESFRGGKNKKFRLI